MATSPEMYNNYEQLDAVFTQREVSQIIHVLTPIDILTP